MQNSKLNSDSSLAFLNASVNASGDGKRKLVRKTSAEIVSEAKSMLAAGDWFWAQKWWRITNEKLCFSKLGGTRLVSARRPITPREPKRQLYGRVAPPGRPPSAFSLKYLQFESRALPSLEPIRDPIERGSVGFTRSDSADSISLGDSNDATNNNNNGTTKSKLPALLKVPSKQSGSLDNRECHFYTTFAIDFYRSAPNSNEFVSSSRTRRGKNNPMTNKK